MTLFVSTFTQQVGPESFEKIHFELTQYRERLNFSAHLARVKGDSGVPINSKHDYSAILALMLAS